MTDHLDFSKDLNNRVSLSQRTGNFCGLSDRQFSVSRTTLFDFPDSGLPINTYRIDRIIIVLTAEPARRIRLTTLAVCAIRH